MVNLQPPLLEVKDFSLAFRTFKKGLVETEVKVIKNLNITINEGEIVAVVGASGSGKSLLASAILGILPKHALTEGKILYKGGELKGEFRGKEVSYIPQSIQSLNPLMKVGKQVQEVIKNQDKKLIQRKIFTQVGLSNEITDKYPFELSGGMARRILAATAIVSPAKLIIADEPTPGLDPQALDEVITLLKQLSQTGKGIMFITHDIDTALKLANKVVVFRDGETIEVANVEDFSGKGEKLQHAYTKELWNALPGNDFFVKEKDFIPITKESSKLEIKGISFKYGDEDYLFKDLHLTIDPGEIVGLHGYSGSGKTTMAKIIAGYLKPENGRVLLGGKQIKNRGIYPIQFIWQHPEKAINPRWKMQKIFIESNMDREVLDELGIKEEWLSRWPSELSGGELQRFCIARAFHNETKFIIADEITTMLDAITQAHLWKMLHRMAKERNIGVLAISHDYYLLQHISDRIINFQDFQAADFKNDSNF
ncbi:ABC transporter ATP-binding protein [Oceanobacillus sp. Castelsardo]|uniref:ABC transporter ATP-binding protein n=1 Tax=Oceanobacillus sp. Castelsardo TaxID=1851204 RepID=UPI000838A84D|nr:ATP-binding cassette domain-containing protein [Oceanobacillus sp. Castelsardo]